MKFSSLTDRIKGGAADVWDMHYLAKQDKGRGEDVIILSVGDPDFATPDAVIEKATQAMRAGDEEAAEANYQDAIRFAERANEFGTKARDLARRRMREAGR